MGDCIGDCLALTNSSSPSPGVFADSRECNEEERELPIEVPGELPRELAGELAGESAGGDEMIMGIKSIYSSMTGVVVFFINVYA